MDEVKLLQYIHRISMNLVLVKSRLMSTDECIRKSAPNLLDETLDHVDNLINEMTIRKSK